MKVTFILFAPLLLSVVDIAALEQNCPSDQPRVVEIWGADPEIDKAHHDFMRRCLIESVAKPNTTILLGPNVVLDFTDARNEDLPLRFGPCVTLTSVSAFGPTAPRACGLVASVNAPRSAGSPVDRSATTAGLPPRIGPARSPSSLGPLLKYGPHRDGAQTFLEIRCDAGGACNDHVRISGFRLYGPSMGQQSTNEVGIQIIRCVDINISNMEIAGWAEQGVRIEDSAGPGGRIHNPSQIVVSNSYIHHNQHPSINDHAAGYGVETGLAATATIAQNVFDFNRHAIASRWDSEGYVASHNLVLKGGGYHDGFNNPVTHEFDAHGSGNNGFSGVAGKDFVFDGNAFQFHRDIAIKIRGRPGRAFFINNIFPHSGLEVVGLVLGGIFSDNAINLHTSDNAVISSDNRINIDTFGQYGVCDFDGDGVDDLFLATGQSWWFASAGEFHWSFLAGATEMLKEIRLGYFDADQRCDVLTERFRQWEVVSGGNGPRSSIGTFGVPLAEVEFGRFDPNVRDHRPGVTRQTTHAFRRAPDGQWCVTPLTGPNWQPVQSSSFPLSQLRFGDFTGDGVTDVLAVNDGRWSISDAARGSWRKLNANLGDDVSGLFIANLDPDDNIDDLLKLDNRLILPPSNDRNGVNKAKIEWWRSKNGTEPWVKLKSYSFEYRLNHNVGENGENVHPTKGFAGRFGVAPGGGTLIIDPFRRGQFFSPAETRVEWCSLFAY